jgi:hypothetical protein
MPHSPHLCLCLQAKRGDRWRPPPPPLASTAPPSPPHIPTHCHLSPDPTPRPLPATPPDNPPSPGGFTGRVSTVCNVQWWGDGGGGGGGMMLNILPGRENATGARVRTVVGDVSCGSSVISATRKTHYLLFSVVRRLSLRQPLTVYYPIRFLSLLQSSLVTILVVFVFVVVVVIWLCATVFDRQPGS